MANEAVEKIRAAELEAEKLRKQAAIQAATLTSAAKHNGEELLSKVESDTRAEIASMKKTIKEKSDRLIEKSHNDAQAETAEIRKSAKMRMRAAADEIIRGIDKI